MFLKQTDARTVTVGAPAKVNLFLDILDKRPDGYHNIHSLFQAVSLFDRLKVTRTDTPGACQISLAKPEDIPLDESNLICKAYSLMTERFDLEGGLEIELEKNIPVAAGLAGGSADAAATIAACNVLFELGLDFSAMAELGLKIGSDLPFFFSTGQALVTGRGEHIQSVELPTDYWLLLVTPDLRVSTGESYARLAAHRRDLALTKSAPARSFWGCKALQELVESLKARGNDFEEVHLRSYPELGRIQDGLLDWGALLARLSGSGPTVFGLYIHLPELKGDTFIGQDDWRLHPVRPIVLPARLP